MKSPRAFFALLAFLLLVVAGTTLIDHPGAMPSTRNAFHEQSPFDKREAAYRANNSNAKVTNGQVALAIKPKTAIAYQIIFRLESAHLAQLRSK